MMVEAQKYTTITRLRFTKPQTAKKKFDRPLITRYCMQLDMMYRVINTSHIACLKTSLTTKQGQTYLFSTFVSDPVL